MRHWIVPLVTALALLGVGAPASAGTRDPLVRTGNGLARGITADGTDKFLGLPYARPPVGNLRWQPPDPPTDWSGIRPATAYGNPCPATASTNGPRAENEDCLYLNVFRPAGTRSDRKLPVYFWIHGGGLTNGSGSQHDGSLLATRNNIVVVSINYRLGVLGYLVHPALRGADGSAGNYGLYDQQAALRWVQRNIGAFGGDPGRVTIGGFSVCANLVAPGSRGLFHRAIIQSGACISQPVAQAETTGVSIAAAHGCADAACLRALPVGALIDGPGFASFVHGVPALPQSPTDAVEAGRFQRVPLIVGSNRDEGRTFLIGNIGMTQEHYVAFVRGTFPDRADAVLARYPWPADADRFTPAYLTAAIFTDAGLIAGLGGCPTLRLIETFAEHTRTYAYRFDHRTGPGLRPEPAGYQWGAGHAAELAYLWPSFDNGTPIAPTFDAAERRLSADMVHYWGSFVRDGRPRAPFAAPWPAFNDTGLVMSLRAGGRSTPVPVARMAAEHNCDLWNAATA
jgi:carboxylesterase type B